VPSWKSIIGDRLIVEDVKVEHGQMYHENGAALIGKHLKETLETLDEKAWMSGAPAGATDQAKARKTKTGAEAA
jgi:ribosomal protein L12E/L44/L45/RPP1/RPP2